MTANHTYETIQSREIRVLSNDEIAKTYGKKFVQIAKIFNHDAVETDDGTWRWKTNSFIYWLDNHAPFYTPSQLTQPIKPGIQCPWSDPNNLHRGSLYLNDLNIDLRRKRFTMEEWMKYQMQSGYSLEGWSNLFHHEASDFKLPGALEKPTDWDDENYFETIIDYMCRIHKGKILKL